MAIAALVGRLVLALVFAVAGSAKLADRVGTRVAISAFGAPTALTAPLAVLLPLAELAVAGLLLPATTAGVGVAGALGLLVLFASAIALSLSQGRAPDCHCFGQLHSAPAGWRTLARNGALAALAVFALASSLTRQDRSAVAWIGRLRGAELLALVVGAAAVVLLAFAGAALLSLLRSYGRVLVRLEAVEATLARAGLTFGEEAPPELGLAPGTPAPSFAVADVRGGTIGLDDLLAPGLPVLLLFTSPRCGPCQALLPEAADWQRVHASRLTVAFANDGPPEELAAEAEEFELENVLADRDRELYAAYQANGTPSAVLIAPDGTIGSFVAPGRDWIEALVAETASRAVDDADDAAVPVGSDVPDLELAVLDGGSVRLTDLRGRDTLLLFWNPTCGFCRSMYERLLAWEGRNGNSPRLVIVSAGHEDAVRAEGFRSTVVLDPEFEISQAFGVGGTPMAVRIDASGRVASAPAAGAEAVFALAER
jgi:peroxiredoxin